MVRPTVAAKAALRLLSFWISLLANVPEPEEEANLRVPDVADETTPRLAIRTADVENNMVGVPFCWRFFFWIFVCAIGFQSVCCALGPTHPQPVVVFCLSVVGIMVITKNPPVK